VKGGKKKQKKNKKKKKHKKKTLQFCGREKKNYEKQNPNPFNH
jgi:hypothetical protein